MSQAEDVENGVAKPSFTSILTMIGVPEADLNDMKAKGVTTFSALFPLAPTPLFTRRLHHSKDRNKPLNVSPEARKHLNWLRRWFAWLPASQRSEPDESIPSLLTHETFANLVVHNETRKTLLVIGFILALLFAAPFWASVRVSTRLDTTMNMMCVVALGEIRVDDCKKVKGCICCRSHDGEECRH